MCRYIRPTYSPSRPRQMSWKAPKAETMSTVDVQPGTALPRHAVTRAKIPSRAAAAPPPRPRKVARRSGASENPVTESIDSLSILTKGYLVEPAARSSRRYSTLADGKPNAGTMKRSTRLSSGRALTASTVARDISR